MVLSVASQKGGVGKTTTAISLAAGLARAGQRVLLVDVDSQANASKVLLPAYAALHADATLHATMLERKPLPVHPSSVPNLAVAPSHILLSNTDIALTTAIDHREARLKQELDAVKGGYDVVGRLYRPTYREPGGKPFWMAGLKEEIAGQPQPLWHNFKAWGGLARRAAQLAREQPVRATGKRQEERYVAVRQGRQGLRRPQPDPQRHRPAGGGSRRGVTPSE